MTVPPATPAAVRRDGAFAGPVRAPSAAPQGGAAGGVVALATAARIPNGMADTPGLVAALEACGMTPRVVVWDDPGVDWTEFAVVVPHCTWDHLERREEFAAWLRDRDDASALANPRDLLARTVDKAYLLDLAARGVPIPTTVRLRRGATADPLTLGEHLGRTELVVKPAVGGGGHRVWRCAGPQEAAELARCELGEEPVLVQGYEPSVARDGELSLVLFHGRLSHVVCKRPRDGDFRVHRRYGATRQTLACEPWMPGYGRRVLSALGAVPLYARVDVLLPAPGRPLLMEVEVLEPDLYLRDVTGAADRFAAALGSRVRGIPPISRCETEYPRR